jgi:hypothetical protein
LFLRVHSTFAGTAIKSVLILFRFSLQLSQPTIR